MLSCVNWSELHKAFDSAWRSSANCVWGTQADLSLHCGGHVDNVLLLLGGDVLHLPAVQGCSAELESITVAEQLDGLVDGKEFLRFALLAFGPL